MKNVNRPPRILYAIQGTGNGHVARAREIIPMLQQFGPVDLLLSGDQSNVALPAEVKFYRSGLTFIYNSRGGLSFWRTVLKNKLGKLMRDIRQFPVHDYDLIINDFECITAWACRWRKKDCIGLGHQAAFYSGLSPRPARRNWLGELILRYYAPSRKPIGFHFENYDNTIFPPVIRQEIRLSIPTNKGHYTVYLPAFDDESLYQHLKLISNRTWEVFSKHAQVAYQRGNVSFYPIENEAFLNSFIHCEGILTSAGFETPAEALHMGKKLLVIPIKSQYEQACNAEALKRLGVPVVKALNRRTIKVLQEWVYSSIPVHIKYPQSTLETLKEYVFSPQGWELQIDSPKKENIRPQTAFANS